MKRIIYFHRNKKAGFSIEKVSTPFINLIENKSVYHVPSERANIKSLIKNLWFVYKKRDKKSIFHVTGDIHYVLLSLIGMKTILTVHDTCTLDFNKGSFLKKKLVKFLWFSLPLRLAKKVVCISENTKKSLMTHVRRKDLIVIPNSVDEAIEFHAKPEKSEKLRLLIIGTNPNKNVEGQIEALKGIDCILTIIGRLNRSQEELLKRNEIKYINRYDLEDGELYEEYYAADIVLFCSFFEGFGMPLIEANKAGTPVICSNIPVLKEIGGDAAIFVNPKDKEEIRKKIIELSKDKELRNSLIENGRKNAENYNINRIYPLWEKLYSSL